MHAVASRSPGAKLTPLQSKKGVEPLRLVHPTLDCADVAPVGANGDSGVPAFGKRQARCELGGLQLAQAASGLAEVAATCRLGAIDPVAEFRDVQVDLENPPLGQVLLERPRQRGFLELAQRIARGRKPEVLGQLLGDRRGATWKPLFLP